MNIYINGDSHSAGAELVKDYCFARDDPAYAHLGELAHPECLNLSYGFRLAKTLNAGFFCEAISASSNARILKTTQQFLKNMPKSETAIIIGWSTWEREEWAHGDSVYQITASGSDQVPFDLEPQYKEWVMRQTPGEVVRKENYWHEKIHNLHKELQHRHIKHMFFNSYNYFGNVENQVDWNDCYIDPYNQSGTYWHWCEARGHQPVNGGYHYGIDAHIAWSKHILARLTNTDNSSTIKTVTQTVQGAKKK